MEPTKYFSPEENDAANAELFYDDQPVECQLYYAARQEPPTAADGIAVRYAVSVN